MQLYGQIKSLVNINDNPAFGDYDAVEKSLYPTEQISHALRSIYSSLKGSDQATYTIDELSSALEQFYDEYVAPIDLPMGDFVEMIVDNQVPKFFKPAIEAIAEKLKVK